jgi:hypothetical protein
VNVKAIASWTMLLALALCATAAPVPAPKVRERPSVVGHWKMTWYGSDRYKVRFWEDGHYSEPTDNGMYEGVWSLKGDRLTVRYRYIPSYSEGYFVGQPDSEWSVDLKPGRLEGRMAGATASPDYAAFRLEPIKGD